MSDPIRPNIDSREGYTLEEQIAYFENCQVEPDEEPTDDDLAEMEEYWDEADDDWEYDEEYDGQPDEYTEWQDYMGGDDWDHGQYDHYDEY